MKPDEFSALLRKQLAVRQITQTDLGKIVGRSRVTVARWLSGKIIPDELTMTGVAAILNR